MVVLSARYRFAEISKEQRDYLGRVAFHVQLLRAATILI